MTDTRRGTPESMAQAAWDMIRSRVKSFPRGTLFRMGYKQGFNAGVERSHEQYKRLAESHVRLTQAAQAVVNLGPEHPAADYKAAIQKLREELE